MVSSRPSSTGPLGTTASSNRLSRMRAASPIGGGNWSCSRPPVPRDLRYNSAYLFGAVCPARGVGAGLVLPVGNGAAMTLYLAEISRQVAPGAHAVVTLDGAGWHQTGGKLRVPDNISLLTLPPYA